MKSSSEVLHTYGELFSVNAPRAVLPYVFSLVRPATVVDIGCGIGTWTSVARELGCQQVKGLDGAHVPKAQRLIADEEFVATDLTDFKSPGRFDLAICLEVAEHLPETSADGFVANLCASTDVILFAAAIPMQGGQGHINEQWPIYWQQKFASHDFIMLDLLRDRFWQDTQVEWWYRQNMFLVCRRNHALAAAGKEFDGNCFVHPELFTAKARGLAKRSRRVARLLRSIFGRP